jgi:hypothetical protein
MKSRGAEMTIGRAWLGTLSAALLAAPLLAAELPDIKVGLWSIDSSAGAADTPRSVLVCMDTAVMRELMKESARMLPTGRCQSAMEKKGSSYIEKTDCSVRGRELQIKSVARLFGDRKFHIDSERTGATTERTLIDGNYLSACPAAMQVGDVVAANGTKKNVLHEDNAAMPLTGVGGSSVGQ